MKFKRLVAFFLVMTMTIGALPSLVFADENDGAPAETKIVESTEPEEKKPAKPAETKSAETKPAETKPVETTKPAETEPAETTVKETEKPAETTAETAATETGKPETTEPAETSAPEKETPEATEPRENVPAETDAKKPASSGDKDGGKENGEKKIDITIEDKPKTYISLKDFDNDELFREYIQRKLTVTKGTKRRALDSVTGRSKLTGNNVLLYDEYKAQIAMVAEGSLTYTVFKVPISKLGLSNPTVYTKEQFGVESLVQGEGIIPELEAAIKAAVEYDGEKILDALLADCPYELYWFKKNSSTKFSGTGCHIEGNGDEITVTWKATEFTASLQVAQPYAADTYQTNPAEIKRANTAISNAASIVSSANGKSDYQKLVFYMNEICKRVAYDKAAAQSGSDANMDPWQLISVFDNDDSTNVVCEGYSKAFKYLCDLTEFENDISCITVTGTLTTPSVSGPHMWNIVTMEDGKNYLVDVTHCDAGSTGDPTMMFMRGYKSGDTGSGYICALGTRDFSYVYDEYTVSTYTDAQLTITNKDYKAGGSIVDSGTCGANLTWTYDDKGILTISGTGAMTDWTTPDNLPWKPYRYDITEIVISDGVTTIGNLAFCSLQNVKNFNIPEGVTSIGNGAFQNCAIKSVYFPSSVTAIGTEAFYGCTSLKSLTIPETVKTIGDRAFALCGTLETVVIAEKITTIGAGAFSDCKGLVSVIMNRDAYSEEAFPGIKTSLLHYYYTVTYASVSNGTISGKTETYGSDTVDFVIEPAPGYDFVKLLWSTASGTPAELKPGTDGKYVMPDSNDDIIITPVFMFGAGYVLSGNSVLRTSDSASVRFNANASGTYYYVVNSSSDAPSAEDIKAASSGVYGNGTADAGTNRIDITGMSSGKQYCHIALFDGEYSSNVITVEMLYDFCYFDDFESYDIDVPVNKGFTPFKVEYDGTGYPNQKVITAEQPNGSSGKVMQLQGDNSWAADIRASITPDNKRYIVFEIDIKSVSGKDAGGLVYGSSKVSGYWTHQICSMGLYSGIVCFNTDENSAGISSTTTYSNNTWYKLTLVLDRTNNKAYCISNGLCVPRGELDVADAAPEWISLGAGNRGVNTTYYDNLRVYSTDTYQIIKAEYNVTFVDGSTTLKTVSVKRGETVSKPSDPVKTGYRFIGWYADSELTTPFDFDNTTILEDKSVYAKFDQEYTVTVTNGNADIAEAIAGEKVTLTADEAPTGSVFDKWEKVSGTVTFADPSATITSFTMPAGNVEVKATYKVQSGTCGDADSDLKWNIDYATGTLTISGTGKMQDWGDVDSVPWYSARESIKSVVIAEGVTSIGNRAFNGYSNITKVTIPVTVDTIGAWAFTKCTSLENVEIPEGIITIKAGAFSGCTGITDVTIPDSVKTIENDVFNGCSKLTGVIIPDGVTSLGNDAFDNCTGLGSVAINSGIYDGDKFTCCAPGIIHFYYDVTYTIGANGTVTGKTRSYATDVIELTVTPDAGYVLDKLLLVYEDQTLPIAPDTDGKFKVKMPESLNGAEIKATFKVAGTEVVGDYVYVITNPATDGTGAVTLTGLANPVTAVVVPATVEINGIIYKVNRIGSKAFYGDKNITSLVIGANVVIIDAYAFYGCSGLIRVSGGLRVQTIGASAFAYCSKLSSFTITSAVLKKIGNFAFNKDKKLKTLYIKKTTKLTKSGVKKSLKGSSVKTVKVKKSKVKKYKKIFKKSNSGRKVKVKK